MNLLIGALTMGLILTPLALGVFITYRLFRTLDLTADGAFGGGAAVVAALLVHHLPPVTATVIGTLAGVAAGAVTGVLQTRLRVSPLLAGVLTTTALYSANLFVMGGGELSLAPTRSLTTLAEELGRRLASLPPMLTLAGTDVSGGSLSSLVLMGVLAVGLTAGLTLFLGTDLGLAMRAAGHNPQMAKAVGIEVDRMTVLGLGIANGLVGCSGALFAQYQGFSNIQMGIGAIVTGVASLMVGETVLGRRPLARWIAGAAAGAVLFRLLVAAAVRAGLNPNALKLVTAAFVLAILVAPDLVRRIRPRARATGAPRDA